MPLRITNEIVDIPLNGGMVKGILNGDETNWNFQSLNKDFLALFASGIVYSHTYMDVATSRYEHNRFQLAIAAHVQELLEEKRRIARVPSPAQRALPPTRRYVAVR